MGRGRCMQSKMFSPGCTNQLARRTARRPEMHGLYRYVSWMSKTQKLATLARSLAPGRPSAGWTSPARVRLVKWVRHFCFSPAARAAGCTAERRPPPLRLELALSLRGVHASSWCVHVRVQYSVLSECTEGPAATGLADERRAELHPTELLVPRARASPATWQPAGNCSLAIDDGLQCQYVPWPAAGAAATGTLLRSVTQTAVCHTGGIDTWTRGRASTPRPYNL